MCFLTGKHMVIKYAPAPSAEELIQTFPEADVILLEGFKYSEYPKIEGGSKMQFLRDLVCDPKYLLGIVTDLTTGRTGCERGNARIFHFFGLEETERSVRTIFSVKW